MKINTQISSNKFRSIAISTFFVGLLLFLQTIVVGSSGNIEVFDVKLYGWISIAMFLFVVYEQKKMCNRLFNLLTIYSLAYYVFSNGEIILLAFNVPYSDLNAFYWGRFSDSEIAIAVLYNTLSLLALNIGMTIAYSKELSDSELQSMEISNKSHSEIKAMRVVGFFLVLISVPFDLYDKLEMAIASAFYGYNYLYTDSYSGVDSVIGSLSLFSIPGCFLLALGLKNHKILKWIPLSYMILRSFIILFAGKRGQSIGLLVALVWFIYENFKTVDKKNSMKLILLGYIGLVIMSAVVNYRATLDKSILGLIDVFASQLIDVSLVKEMLNEMGFSIRPLLEIIGYDYSGQHALKYGMTYVFSLIMIIPSFLRGSLYELGVSNGWLGVEEWLTNSVGSTYGLGFSLQAESYYNFGIFGWAVMIIFGMVISPFLTKSNINTKMKTIKSALNATFLALLIISARSTSQLLFKYIVYYYTIPFLLLYLVGNTYKIKYREKEIDNG